MPKWTHSLQLWLLPALSLAFAACSDDHVVSYRIPKERPLPSTAAVPPFSPEANKVSPAIPADSGTGLVWTAPLRWIAKPAGEVRKASYTVPGPKDETADFSITAFPGAVGGEWANLNRWRGQLSLPPIEASELESAVTRRNHNGLAFTVVELASSGDSPRRLLGAMVPHEGALWFFKLIGPDAAVSAARNEFTALLDTVTASTTPAP